MTDTQNDPLDITSGNMQPNPQALTPPQPTPQPEVPAQPQIQPGPIAQAQALEPVAQTPVASLAQNVAAPVMGTSAPQIPQAQINQTNPFGTQAKVTPNLAQVHSASSKGFGKTLLSFALLFIFFTIIGFGGYFAYDNLNNEDSAQNTTLDQLPLVSEPTVSTTSLTVTSPTEGSIVSDTISLEGEVEGISSFMVSLFDSNDTLIDRVSLEPASSTWSSVLSFESMPSTNDCYIVVTSTDGKTEYQKINLVYKNTLENDRIKISNLTDKAVIESKELALTGEMTGFFEGVANIRLLSEESEVILEDFFTAEGDNYEDFASFEVSLAIPDVYFVDSKTITVEIYEVSGKDGSEISILSFDLVIDTAEI